MHKSHYEAAHLHTLAAQAHRTAAERNEKDGAAGANQHEERALDYSNRAHELAIEAHNKSGKLGSL